MKFPGGEGCIDLRSNIERIRRRRAVETGIEADWEEGQTSRTDGNVKRYCQVYNVVIYLAISVTCI